MTTDNDEGVGKLAIIVSITAPISIISSLAILIMILRSDKGLSKLYYRIIFGISICDIIHSFALSFGTIPMPRDTEHVWKALGNQGTCNAQGFLFTFSGIAVPMYTFSLCIFYYLSVRHRMSEEDITNKNIEKYLHIIPIGWSLTVALMGLCTNSFRADKKSALCRTPALFSPTSSQGMNINIIIWILQGCGIILSSLGICYTMYSIYRTAKDQEERMNEFSFRGTTRRHERVRKIWIRAISYVIVLVLTYVPGFLANGFLLSKFGTIKPLFVIAYVFYPMQGLYNLLIFTQTSVAKIRSEQNLSYFKALVLACQTFGRRRNDDARNDIVQIP